jgi:hypothetical protein
VPPILRRCAVAGLLVAVILLLQAASASARVPARFWGVSLLDQNLSTSDLDAMQAGGVGSVGLTLFRQYIEPEQGSFRWTATDNLIGDLASRGLLILPTVYGSPGYAGSTPATPPLGSAAKRKGWKTFLEALVARYGPGGAYWTQPLLFQLQHPGKQPMPITSWQVWNEPSLPGFFGPRPSVGAYAKLLRISHQAITTADPSAKTVLGGLFGYAYKPRFYAWHFLGRLYRKPGLSRDFDVVSLHPYGQTLAEVEDQVSRTRKAMKRHGDGQTPLWVTEIGWGSGHPRKGLNRGRRGQRRMLTRTFRALREHRRSWHLRHVDWFSWRDPPTYVGECHFCPRAGLFDRRMRPKPSWNAYRGFTHSLP